MLKQMLSYVSVPHATADWHCTPQQQGSQTTTGSPDVFWLRGKIQGNFRLYEIPWKYMNGINFISLGVHMKVWF